MILVDFVCFNSTVHVSYEISLVALLIRRATLLEGTFYLFSTFQKKSLLLIFFFTFDLTVQLLNSESLIRGISFSLILITLEILSRLVLVRRHCLWIVSKFDRKNAIIIIFFKEK